MAKYIAKFNTLPKELFRLNAGSVIALRDRAVKPKGSFDVLSEAGKVKPKALNPATYAAPNGASMRPNTSTQNDLVRTFKGKDITVFAVPKGTTIPEDLVLVHEFKDHYSLQPARDMTLAELNAKITSFLNSSGQRMSKEEWLEAYPEPTEDS